MCLFSALSLQYLQYSLTTTYILFYSIWGTHSDRYVNGASDSRFEVRVEDDSAEENFMARFVDGLVCLDEHRVALVHVVQRS